MTAAPASQTGRSATPAPPRTRLSIWRRRAAAGKPSARWWPPTARRLRRQPSAAGVSAASASTHDWIATGWKHPPGRPVRPPPTAKHFFNTPRAHSAPAPRGVRQTPSPTGFAANAVLVYGSYAQFAFRHQKRARSARAYKWVLYDPEEWSQTPVAEQLDPHQIPDPVRPARPTPTGTRSIEAPGRDLGKRGTPPAPPCLKLAGEDPGPLVHPL